MESKKSFEIKQLTIILTNIALLCLLSVWRNVGLINVGNVDDRTHIAPTACIHNFWCSLLKNGEVVDLPEWIIIGLGLLDYKKQYDINNIHFLVIKSVVLEL